MSKQNSWYFFYILRYTNSQKYYIITLCLHPFTRAHEPIHRIGSPVNGAHQNFFLNRNFFILKTNKNVKMCFLWENSPSISTCWVGAETSREEILSPCSAFSAELFVSADALENNNTYLFINVPYHSCKAIKLNNQSNSHCLMRRETNNNIYKQK